MRNLRSGNAGANLLALTGSGVATVLLTRAYLHATGYPKIGGGGLHIAHVLWGGLLMVAALGVVLTHLGPRAQALAAVLGGAGFGLFIDEVGKFVTERTDYFYQPAAGLIYLAFAILGVVTFRMRDSGPTTERQRAAQAVALALAGVTIGLTAEQRASAQRLVGGSNREVDVALARLLAAVPERRSRWRDRLDRLTGRVRDLLTPRRRTRLVTVSLWTAVVLPFVTLAGGAGEWITGDLFREQQTGAIAVVLVAAASCAVLGVRAAVMLRHDRAAALRVLHLSLLVDLLIAQVFKFTVHQFAAAAEAGVNVVLLAVLLAERRRLTSTDATRAPDSVTTAG